jgi:hypothetical protein
MVLFCGIHRNGRAKTFRFFIAGLVEAAVLACFIDLSPKVLKEHVL